MKPLYALSISALIPLGLSAQTMTQADMPVPGDQFLINYGPYVATSGGSNMTWDFSTLSADSSETIQFVDPAGTPMAASFPGATVAQYQDNSYTYFQTSGTDMLLLGVDADGIIVPYQDPEQWLQVPCSFGTTWSDNLAASFSSSGFPVNRSGSVTGNADGFGSVVMPFGTVNNVLRVRLVEDYTDQTIVNIDYDFITDFFYKPGLHAPLVQIGDYTVTTLITVNDQRTQWLDGSAVGIAEALTQDIGIDVFPNPASDRIEVVYGASGRLTLELVDATGRTVQVRELGQRAPGVHRDVVDIAGQPAGLYVLRIRNEAGETGTKRLIIR